MGILKGILDEPPPYEKYWTHVFQNKSMPVLGECQTKVFPFSRHRDKIFSLEDDTHKYTSSMIREMVVTADKVLISDIRDEKKATAKHLASAGGRICWDNTSDVDHAAGLFKMEVNGTSEIYVGAMTGQL